MGSAPQSKTVYVDGVFDLFHAGHVSFLKRAKLLGGPGARLVVGVISDADAGWKRRPYVGHADRVYVVRNCKAVDAVVEAPPLVLNAEFLDSYKIDVVVHGDDDRQEQFFRIPIERGIMRYVPYTPGISTTAIAQRVAARVPAAAHPAAAELVHGVNRASNESATLAAAKAAANAAATKTTAKTTAKTAATDS